MINPVYPYYNPYLPPYQQPAQPTTAPQPTQGMTPPTVHCDMIQVDNEAAGVNYPVAVGAPQMMITKDEGLILIKTAYANGQSSVEYYDKRHPAPAPAPVDMGQYITRAEFDKLVASLKKEAE